MPATAPSRVVLSCVGEAHPRRRFTRLALTSLIAPLAFPMGCGPRLGTIGAILGRTSDGRVFLRRVPSDLAAARAGLRAGDEVLLIEGRDVRAMSVKEVHRALVGEVGEPVKLTLIRGTKVIRTTLPRTEARPYSKTSSRADSGAGIP